MEHALYGSITIGHYVMLATMLFVTGICGIFLNRKNIITLLMSIELMLLSVNINFVAFSVKLADLGGADIHHFRAHGSSGGSRNRPRHSRSIFP
jgi:NADH:ubiquinone oxidoreductase subunit K